MDNSERYEQDREEMGVNEHWAEDHGYSRGRCKVHGTFWTDSGDGCPSCDEHREPEPEDDEGEMDCDYMQLMLAAWQKRMDNLEMIRRAAEQQNGFFFDALKRNGVFHE